MLCRCVRNCYRRGQYWKAGQEQEFDSCPPSFVPAAPEAVVIETVQEKEPATPHEPEPPSEPEEKTAKKRVRTRKK